MFFISSLYLLYLQRHRHNIVIVKKSVKFFRKPLFQVFPNKTLGLKIAFLMGALALNGLKEYFNVGKIIFS